MSFCTAINCMDGRVQLPVIEYLMKRFDARWVDEITEPGPNGILARGNDEILVGSIMSRLAISVEKHGSSGIAVVGHHDCAGNPGGRDKQDADTRAAVAFVRRAYPDLPAIGLWLGDDWRVVEIDAGDRSAR